MNRSIKGRLAIVLGLAAAVTLPLAAHWIRNETANGCALDGAMINPAYRVETVDADGHRRTFCCFACAAMWIRHESHPPQSIEITDEASGEEIDIHRAYLVRSPVVTTPTTGNRIHAFRNRADAEKHANTFGGRLLPDSETLLH
jgi:hypothetical protein